MNYTRLSSRFNTQTIRKRGWVLQSFFVALFCLVTPTTIGQIAIQEGKYGSRGSVRQFTISLRVDGQWRDVYEGTTIGGSFGVVLPETHTADAIRLAFHEWKGRIAINQINVYGLTIE